MLDNSAKGFLFSNNEMEVPDDWKTFWKINWSYFLYADSDFPNQTRFSPSIVFDQRSEPISIFDFESERFNAYQLPPKLRVDKALIQSMCKDLDMIGGAGDRWQRFCQARRPMPMILQYLAEDQYAKHPTGRLGPIGSEVFRYAVLEGISKARSEIDATVRRFGKEIIPKPKDLPASFAAMIKSLK